MDKGKSGRVRSGRARAEALAPERRSEIARSGALARWKAESEMMRTGRMRAMKGGNFKEHFGIDAECYVLDDATKTPVISQTGIAKVLGFSPRGNALTRFLNSQAMADYVSAELRGKIENPLVFQWGSGGAEAPPITVHGVDATQLIDICNAIIAADNAGKLSKVRHKGIVQQAHIIRGASARSGIQRLVYDLAGYNPTIEETIAAFKAYVQEEAKTYEQEFPSQLYVEWHRLYDLPVPLRGKPWQFKYLTVRHIYVPLAKSNGKILILLRALKRRGGDRRAKLFQFLNAVGAQALRMHLGRVLEMAEDSPDKDAYERRIMRRFGGQSEFDFVFPTHSTASSPPSEQSPPAAPG